MTTEAQGVHVLAATDLSNHSEAALRTAAEIAARFGGRTTLIHCLEVSSVMPAHLSVSRTEELRRNIEQELRTTAERRLEELRERFFPGDKSVHVEVVLGAQVADTICRYAARQNADWLVLGTHGLSGLVHMLIGSVAERVVRHAPCTTVIARSTTHKGGD